MLFYTGFPNYEALMSFHNYIELKVRKIQYWKGEKLLNESRPYQMDKNKSKAGPSRTLTYLQEFVLVLLWLKAGLFVLDLWQIWNQHESCFVYLHYMDKFSLCGTSWTLPLPIARISHKEHASRVCWISYYKNYLDCSEVCWHNLKLGHIINTITHGKCQWLSLKMDRCLSFQTCGENRFQTSKLLEKAVFSFVRAWWQYHGWQGIWYFWCHAKWCNSKRASFLGWKGSDDWGGN